MTQYRLTIVALENNPLYDPTRSNPYGPPHPQHIETEALRMFVTQEQFNAIRKAALEVAK